MHHGPAQLIQNNSAAMALDFHHILSGKRMRAFHHDHQCLVYD
jgi:hypothetical protein